VAREVRAWIESGWRPPSAFSAAVRRAYRASQSGAPDSVVASILAPHVERLGASVVGEAMARIHAAANRMTRKEIRGRSR
jgi:hypothetical protein